MSRVPPLEGDEAAPAGRTLFEEIANSRGSVGNLWKTLAHSPELARRVAAVGEHVRYQSLLPPDLRELAVLTVSQRTGCAYEWSHHAALARESGLREMTVRAMESGAEPVGLTPEQEAVYRYVEQLCRHARASDETYAAVEGFLTPNALVELTVTVGYYTLLAYILNGLEVDLDADAGPPPAFA